MVSATPIHLHVTGSTAGPRHVSFSQSPVTFGRGPDNAVVLLDAAVSRQHGELRFENDAWYLVNHSVNGTRARGKRVTAKPRKLQNGDEIAVEDVSLFTISIGDAPTSLPAVDASPQATAPAARPMSRKTKLWIGIGSYLGLMLLVLIFAQLYKDDSPEGTAFAPMLTEEQIAAEIRKPLQLDENPERAVARLRDARQLYHRPEAAYDALYQAHRAYKESLAYSGRAKFTEGLDHQHFDETEMNLIAQVSRRYRDAYALLSAGSLPEAERAFADLQRFYSDSQSEIFLNAQQQQAAIRRQLGTGSGRNL